MNNIPQNMRAIKPYHLGERVCLANQLVTVSERLEVDRSGAVDFFILFDLMMALFPTLLTPVYVVLLISL